MKQKTILVSLVILAIAVGVFIGYKLKTPALTENSGAVALSDINNKILPSSKYNDSKETENLPKEMMCNLENEKGEKEQGLKMKDGTCLSFNNIPLESEGFSEKVKDLVMNSLTISGAIVSTSEPQERKICFNTVMLVPDNSVPWSNGSIIYKSVAVRVCEYRFLGLEWVTIALV